MFRSPFVATSYQTTAFKKPGAWKCGYHTGVDRVCDSIIELVAIGDGKVESVNACGSSYGKHVVLRIDGKYSVLYAHMKNDPLVKVGSKVSEGQLIGYMGNTGNSYGAHLHIEIQNGSRWAYDWNLLNPNDFIDWDDFGGKSEAEKKFTEIEWVNGSSREYVFSAISDCKNGKADKSVGWMSPYERAVCVYVHDGCYLVIYRAGGTQKAGWVRYSGGVKI